MYYLTITAKRKNAKRHIFGRYETLDEAVSRVKDINPRYRIEIYTGNWQIVRSYSN